jgi:hypothetical protein
MRVFKMNALYYTLEYQRDTVIPDIFPELLSNELVHIGYGGLEEINAIGNFLHTDEELIVSEIVEQYNQGKRIFVYECLREGLVLPVMLKFFRITTKINLPDASFIWLTGDPNGKKIVEDYWFKRIPKKPFQVWGAYYFEYLAHHTFLKYSKEYTPGPREKTFLCYNNILRPARVEFLEQMLKHDLVKDSYYSFIGGSRGTTTTNGLLAILAAKGTTTTNGLLDTIDTNLYPNIHNNKEILPLILGNTKADDLPWSPELEPEDYMFFENSYFSVVTETLYYQENLTPNQLHAEHVPALIGLFLTEKTYKPIAMKHPFILLAPAHSLRMLRERGYKTFSPFIDESYDEIENDTLRLQAVVEEVKRLSKSDLVEFTYQIKDIVEHNEKILRNQTVFVPNKIKNQ